MCSGNFKFYRGIAQALGAVATVRRRKSEKAPAVPEPFVFGSRPDAYLSAVCTLVKVVFSFEPRPCTTAMIATEMPAAMRPYSIAVAPEFVLHKALNQVRHIQLLKVHTWLSERGPGSAVIASADPEPCWTVAGGPLRLS